MITITSDPSREIKWYFRINRDNRKTFRFFNSGGAAFDFTGYAIVINFKQRENDSTNFLQLTSGSGFTLTGNDIAVWLTKTQAARFRDASYFVEFVVTNSSNERNWFTCEGVFHNGKFDGVSSTSTESIVIYDGANIVNVTVYDGITQSTLPFGTHDASGGAFPTDETYTLFLVTVEGSLNGVYCGVGDLLMRLQDNPTSDWTITGWKKF